MHVFMNLEYISFCCQFQVSGQMQDEYDCEYDEFLY